MHQRDDVAQRPLTLRFLSAALRNSRTNARAHVAAQSIFAESARLSQDDAVPEVAANGGSAR